MIVGVIADIHGNSLALNAVLEELHRLKVEKVWCAGDITGYFPYVNEVINRLVEENAICVMGNHDAALCGLLDLPESKRRDYMLHVAAKKITPSNLAWLSSLPPLLFQNLGDRKALICHASPWEPFEEYIYPDFNGFDRFASLPADLIVMGHTHWSFTKRIRGKVLLNPGSCGQPRDVRPGASFAVLDSETLNITHNRVMYNFNELLNKLENLNYPRVLIDSLTSKNE